MIALNYKNVLVIMGIVLVTMALARRVPALQF
jgi:hypothetical protein